jgi:hypothetical protein
MIQFIALVLLIAFLARHARKAASAAGVPPLIASAALGLAIK